MSPELPRQGYRLKLGHLVYVLLGAASACHGMPDPALAQLGQARKLTADARIQLARAAAASDRAVMADTDEDSATFAREAERAVQALDGDALALAPLLKALRYEDEVRFLDEFTRHFVDYRKLDHTLLELAVENTNLKAQRLSFGPIREAADAFRESLDAVVNGVSAKDRCRVESLADRAVLAIRETQVLQAPHIAEPDDTGMTHLEKEMASRQATARDAMTALTQLVPSGPGPGVAAAAEALGRFTTFSGQLIALSRRNSNVRSLALALRQKPPLTVACDASLIALENALAKEGLTATR